MRALIAAALLFATTLAAHAAVETLPAGVSLRGDWQEGAVLFGKAPVGSKVWFGDRQLKLTPAGDFVFGINRDAPDSAGLRVQLPRSEEHTSELQSLMRISYAVFCLQKKKYH